jgi:hypothetical protein
MGTQTLLVVATATLGLAATVLLVTMKHRANAVLVQRDHGVRDDQSVLDTWEDEGGNAE